MMFRSLAASVLFLALAGEARADSCDTLITNAQGALSNPAATAAEKLFLQELLKAAQAAKLAGDQQACQSALQSPRPFRDPSKGRDCNETPDTV